MPRPGTPVVHPGLLSRVRPVHEGAMTDECTITEPASTDPVVSEDGLDVTFPAGVVRYAGPCRVMPYADGARVVQTQERTLTLRTYRVFLPWHAGPVDIDDVVTVTASADPDLDGLGLRVIDIQRATLEAERALVCEEVVD